MNLDNFTIKAQKVIEASVLKARENKNQAIETGHILLALLDDKDGIISTILSKL